MPWLLSLTRLRWRADRRLICAVLWRLILRRLGRLRQCPGCLGRLLRLRRLLSLRGLLCGRLGRLVSRRLLLGYR